MLCSLFAQGLNQRSRKNAINATYLEDQLNIEANTALARQIADGKLDEPYKPKENDLMGSALLEMREKLKALKEVELKQTWVNQGINKVSDLLLSITDTDTLTQTLIMDIVKYLGAFHGGIFLYEEDKLTLQAYYGLSASEYEKLSIDAGEGLIGECALNKKPILLDEVPEQYETIISSGLGQAPPNSIMLYPLYANNITVGVIEVASFHKFTEHDKLLMEKVAESIAVTLSSKLNR